jgi:hypothetical protein
MGCVYYDLDALIVASPPRSRPASPVPPLNRIVTIP